MLDSFARLLLITCENLRMYSPNDLPSFFAEYWKTQMGVSG